MRPLKKAIKFWGCSSMDRSGWEGGGWGFLPGRCCLALRRTGMSGIEREAPEPVSPISRAGERSVCGGGCRRERAGLSFGSDAVLGPSPFSPGVPTHPCGFPKCRRSRQWEAGLCLSLCQRPGQGEDQPRSCRSQAAVCSEVAVWKCKGPWPLSPAEISHFLQPHPVGN